MRALVVCESMYGNTHVVASNIADGLRATHEVSLVPVARASRELVDAADLLIVGGPALDPDAGDLGLREWLHGMGRGHGLAAAFDTRLTGAPAATGRASRTIGRLLRQHGYQLVDAPEDFLVSKQSTLLDGEAARARCWGAALGDAASHLYHLAQA